MVKSPSLTPCAGTMWEAINISQPSVSPFNVDRIVNHCIEVLDFQSELNTRNLCTHIPRGSSDQTPRIHPTAITDCTLSVPRDPAPHSMSDLQKSFAKAKLGRLPSEAPMSEPIATLNSPQEEEGSSASSLSSTGTLVPSPTRHLFARKGSRFA